MVTLTATTMTKRTTQHTIAVTLRARLMVANCFFWVPSSTTATIPRHRAGRMQISMRKLHPQQIRVMIESTNAAIAIPLYSSPLGVTVVVVATGWVVTTVVTL